VLPVHLYTLPCNPSSYFPVCGPAAAASAVVATAAACTQFSSLGGLFGKRSAHTCTTTLVIHLQTASFTFRSWGIGHPNLHCNGWTGCGIALRRASHLHSMCSMSAPTSFKQCGHLVSYLPGFAFAQKAGLLNAPIANANKAGCCVILFV